MMAGMKNNNRTAPHMNLSNTQLAALHAVVASGLGVFDFGFYTAGGPRFRADTGLALVRAGLLERSTANPRHVRPTIAAHTVIALAVRS